MSLRRLLVLVNGNYLLKKLRGSSFIHTECANESYDTAKCEGVAEVRTEVKD